MIACTTGVIIIIFFFRVFSGEQRVARSERGASSPVARVWRSSSAWRLPCPPHPLKKSKKLHLLCRLQEQKRLRRFWWYLRDLGIDWWTLAWHCGQVFETLKACRGRKIPFGYLPYVKHNPHLGEGYVDWQIRLCPHSWLRPRNRSSRSFQSSTIIMTPFDDFFQKTGSIKTHIWWI